MKSTVVSDRAPSAVGPYSQAIFANDLLFVSGQLPLDPTTGNIVSGGAVAQAQQSLKNALAVVEAAGLNVADVVKTTIFLTDLVHYAAVNKVYEEAFGEQFPARSVIQVAGLPKGAEVEIEMIAVTARSN